MPRYATVSLNLSCRKGSDPRVVSRYLVVRLPEKHFKGG